MAVLKRPVSQRRSLKKKTNYKAKAGPYKKRTSSRALGLGRVTALTSNDFGFPDRLSTKLVYGDNIGITMTSGATGVWSFRLNSCYDPDLTGFGHKPQWFNQLSTVYGKYRVKGAKITVDFIHNSPEQPGTTAYGPFLVGITTSTASTLSASTVPSLTEDANGVSKVLGPKEGGHNMCTLSNTYSPTRDLGLDSYDPDLAALVNSNPSTMFYAHVWSTDMGTISSSNMRARVKIEFQVEFFNRIEGVLS